MRYACILFKNLGSMPRCGVIINLQSISDPFELLYHKSALEKHAKLYSGIVFCVCFLNEYAHSFLHRSVFKIIVKYVCFN